MMKRLTHTKKLVPLFILSKCNICFLCSSEINNLRYLLNIGKHATCWSSISFFTWLITISCQHVIAGVHDQVLGTSWPLIWALAIRLALLYLSFCTDCQRQDKDGSLVHTYSHLWKWAIICRTKKPKNHAWITCKLDSPLANNREFSTVILFMANKSLHVCMALMHKLFIQVTWSIFWLGNLRLRGACTLLRVFVTVRWPHKNYKIL